MSDKIEIFVIRNKRKKKIFISDSTLDGTLFIDMGINYSYILGDENGLYLSKDNLDHYCTRISRGAKAIVELSIRNKKFTCTTSYKSF